MVAFQHAQPALPGDGTMAGNSVGGDPNVSISGVEVTDKLRRCMFLKL